MDPIRLLIIFLIVCVGGVLLEILLMSLYFKLTKKHYKTHHYAFGKYLFFLIFPLLSALIVVNLTNIRVFYVFAMFALVGTFMEYFIGWAYLKIEGQRLWTYHKYAISKFTSFLSIPLWGFMGIFSYLVTVAFKI